MSSQVYQIIGARVRQRRNQLGWSTRGLADKAGCSQTAIVDYENERRPNISGDILIRLAAALGVSADYLLGKTDDLVSDVLSEEWIAAFKEFTAVGMTPAHVRMAVRAFLVLRELMTDAPPDPGGVGPPPSV